MSGAPAQSPPASAIGKLTALFPKTPEGRPKFITEPHEFNETMERLAASGLCNLLCSIQYVDYIPPVQAVSLRVIPTREDMYYAPKGWGDGFALKGETLAALFREAGGSYRHSERLDDAKDRLYCHMQATVVMRAMNGLDAPFSKDREIDLRPGSPEAKNMTDKQLGQAQQTILRVCETKAQLRAIRTAIGAAQSYTGERAALPFVIPTLVPNPDMDNPVHANFMLAHSMGAVDQLYGKKALPPATISTPAGMADAHTGEVIDVDPAEVNAAAGGGASAYGDLPGSTGAACGCPCGCAEQVREEIAALTIKKGGGVRCADCWPGARFVYDKHKNLGSLGLTPDISPKEAAKLAGSK